MFRRLRAATRTPRKLPGFCRLHATKAAELLRRGRIRQAAGYLGEVLTERNVYYDRLARKHGGHLLEREVRGSRMYLRPAEAGLSRTLLAYGVHEHCSTVAFERELRRLRATTDGEVIALDIGANIGYFSLLIARVLGPRARIYAVEPDPDNLALLELNVESNGYADRIEIERCAVGGTVDRAELRRHDQSNRHMVIADPDAPSAAATARRADASADDSVSVPQVTVERFLEDRVIAPEAVGVVRMDFEGYEAEVFAGMKRVLAAAGPTLVHIEIHPRYLTDESIGTITALLETNGFEIASAVASEGRYSVYERQRWHGVPLDLDGFDELRSLLLETNQYVELIAQKR